jgi:hypothetical protein
MDWRKSSFSGENGSCIETAGDTGVILVRDTTNRQGFTLSVPAKAWQTFTRGLK